MTDARPLLLRYEQIEVRSGDRVLINIASLDVNAGECILISGDNGSGKTILLKVIAGLLQPGRCNVVHGDQRVPWRKARALCLKKVVYVHDLPYMLDSTVSRNIAYAMRVSGTPASQIADKVADVLRWANLDHLAYRSARHLSGGEQQRIALLRAYVTGSPVLALDDPTAKLDRSARNQTYDMIAQLRDDGACVLVASHDASVMSAVCDRHFRLQAGRLVPAAARARKPSRHDNVMPFPQRKI